MKLTKEDILNIDRYLIKKGIKYIDVRYELIDHLVSEYESMENYPDLESFLRRRTVWCRKVAEKKVKSVDLGNQKSLLRRILSLLRNPVYYGILLVWIFLIFSIYSEYGTTILNKTMLYLLIGVIAIQIIDCLYWRSNSKKENKILSTATIFNIYSLPNVFIYIVVLLESQFEAYPVFSIAYFSIGIFINVTALFEVYRKRAKALKEYDFLKAYFE